MLYIFVFIIRHPLIKWAQRKDRLFLQIQLQDIQKQKIELTPTAITFDGFSDQKHYGFSIQFFQQIDKQLSKWTKTGFHLLFVIIKKDSNIPFWTRLTKQKQKNQYIQIDWQKWVDQDEQQQEGHKGLSGVDPSQMQNFDFANMDGSEDDNNQHQHDHENCQNHNHHHKFNIDDIQKEGDVQDVDQRQTI